MKIINLQKIEHSVKIGDACGHIEPNITEDCLFVENEEVIGFYIKEAPEKLKNLVSVANAELLSERVPKSEMRRSSGLRDASAEVKQFSTIIGSCPPKPHMKRPYPSISSVHQVPSARTFIKAMLLACAESEKLIKEIAPTIYERQKKIISENVPPQFRLGELFTSSISNFNIASAFHRDAGNLEGCVNVIIAKRKNAQGGNTTIPDYAATADSRDNSILVYPAWRNVHGVTPIIPLAADGYRNTLVFYPLKAFNKYW
jgi:hypothetical protein